MFARLKAMIVGAFYAGVVCASVLGPVAALAQTKPATLSPTNPKFTSATINGTGAQPLIITGARAGGYQAMLYNTSDASTAYAEYLVKSATTLPTSVYLGAEAHTGNSFTQDRGYMIANPSGTTQPGFDFYACTSGSPAGCTIRYITNSSALAGVRASVAASGIIVNNALTLGFSADGTTTTDTGLSRVSAGIVGVGTGAAGSFAGTIKATAAFLAGKITTYNNLTTTGNGVPSILQSGRGTAITSSLDANRCTFTPAADGTFEVWDYILVTTAGAATNMNGTITFKTEDSSARSVAVVWQLAAGGTVTNVLTAAGTVGYYGIPIIIRAQAATAITVSTTGTPSTAVYNHECSIHQIA